MKKTQFEKYIKLASGKCLDIGCGNGWVGREIMNLNPNIEMYGIDLYSEKMKEKYKKVYSGNILNLQSIVDEKFDLIICFHILEHIQTDKINDLVKNINKVLKIGGIVVVETPHPITKYTPKKFLFNFWNDPTHIKPYNSYQLEKVFYNNCFSTQYKGFDQTNFVEMGESYNSLSVFKRFLYKLGLMKSTGVYVGMKVADKDDLIV